MNDSRISKFWSIADLAICGAWVLLLVHRWGFTTIEFLCPVLRIWTNFLMKRRSKLAAIPLAALSILCLELFSYRGILFVRTVWIQLLSSARALINAKSFSWPDYYELSDSLGDLSHPIIISGVVWMVVIPWCIYIWRLCKKQLPPGGLSRRKTIGLCVYIPAMVFASDLVEIRPAGVVAMLLILLIPVFFNDGSIKGLLSRGEITYLLTLAILMLGDFSGVRMKPESVIAVCVLPAAFFILMNWNMHREANYKDILWIFAASIIFWGAQYTTDATRLLHLFASLSVMAVPFVQLAIETKKKWASAGIYAMVALVLPLLSLGYNPYAVLNAKRVSSNDALMSCETDDGKCGLRDRYGVVLPIEYDNIRVLSPSKPYWKVEKDNKWQIYDIYRQELLSEERFGDIICHNENVYQLKPPQQEFVLDKTESSSDEEVYELKDFFDIPKLLNRKVLYRGEVYEVKTKGADKYLILPEHCFDKVQRAIITGELPEEIQGLSAENYEPRCHPVEELPEEVTERLSEETQELPAENYEH